MRTLLSWCLILVVPCAFAEINMDSLIKIDNQSNPKCVEYYNVEGDMYCSTKPLNPNGNIDPKLKDYEKQHVVFDNRIWQAIWGQKSDTITTIEYIPAGGNIDDWQELVTTQFIPNLQEKISLSQYANSIMDNLRKTGLNPVISVIDNNPNEILFEFRINAPTNMQQNELQKVMLGKDGFYVLHYVIKQPDMGDANRQKWLQNLRNSGIKDN